MHRGASLLSTSGPPAVKCFALGAGAKQPLARLLPAPRSVAGRSPAAHTLPIISMASGLLPKVRLVSTGTIISSGCSRCDRRQEFAGAPCGAAASAAARAGTLGRGPRLTAQRRGGRGQRLADRPACPPLTLMMRNTLRAVATEAWIFFTLPGCPADTNIAAYCTAASSLSRPSDLSRNWLSACGQPEFWRGQGRGAQALVQAAGEGGGWATAARRQRPAGKLLGSSAPDQPPLPCPDTPLAFSCTL